MSIPKKAESGKRQALHFDFCFLIFVCTFVLIYFPLHHRISLLDKCPNADIKHMLYQSILGVKALYIYTVERGDTLFLIAQRFRTTVDLIVAANRLPDPNRLLVGEKLLIPVPGPIRVRVQPGDSLWAISQRFDVSVEVLAAANNIQPPYTIFPNQVLMVPIVLPQGPGCITWISNRTGRPDIYVRSPQDPRPRRITFNLALESSVPAWSPNGNLIAFIGRGNALWVVNPTTLNADRLIENLQIFTDFDWSPDSTTIAFSRREAVPAIITIEVATGQTRFITEGTEVNYLPDGRRILFESSRTGLSQLYIINTDGTGLRQVTRNTEGGVIQSVALSPDGSRAAYTFPGVSISMVRIVDLATGQELETPAGPLGRDFNPVWSPNGQYLAYNASTEDEPAGLRGIIRVVDVNGAFVQDLTDTACFGDQLTWSPNSTRVLYSNCLMVAPQLSVVGFTGLPIQITSLGGNENPDWTSASCPPT